MEKRKWLWKRRSSEKSPGERSDSSESMSSPSEKEAYNQEECKTSPSHSTPSPEITMKTVSNGDDLSETVRNLTEKLSAALVNVSDKEDLVNQHSKVAEEAVAGWEKAETELAVLKEQLESTKNRNSTLEDRVGHLDGALKECVRQLRQARDEHEQRLQEALAKTTQQWESTKSELENKILELKNKNDEISRTESFSQVDLHQKIEFLEQENLDVQLELQRRCKDLQVRTIERDLSTRAAEMASKQYLESIKKVAKLEADCRKLRTVANKSSSLVTDTRSVAASSIYVESLTDSHSDGDYRFNTFEKDTCNSRNSNKGSASVNIDFMDDFLEMEKLASLSENSKSLTTKEKNDTEDSKLRTEIGAMIDRMAELELKIETVEEEKAELQKELGKSRDASEASQVQLMEAVIKLEDLQRNLNSAIDAKKSLEDRLAEVDVESVTLSSKVEALEAEVEKEKATAGEKCRSFEEVLTNKDKEIQTLRYLRENNQPKIKQEDLTIASGRLGECQKTIVSLRKQLESLATLEDFLIDTKSIPPESSPGGLVVPRANGELWKFHSNDTFLPRKTDSGITVPSEISDASSNKSDSKKPQVSSSALSAVSCSNQGGVLEKNRNGFSKFFSRNKNGVQLEI